MILGTEARVRPLIELVESATDIELARPRSWPLPSHRDRGHFLALRLYPTAPFQPWQPVSSYVTPAADVDENRYAVASESM
jgi:hypothetical protein